MWLSQAVVAAVHITPVEAVLAVIGRRLLVKVRVVVLP
jgi:hypothetical protein